MDKIKAKLSTYSIDQIKELESRAFGKGVGKKRAISNIIDTLPIIELSFRKVGPLHRCRISPEGAMFSFLKELLWPPTTIKFVHRLRGRNLVYFSDKPQTALLEVLSANEAESQLVSIISISSTESCMMFPVGEVYNFIMKRTLSISQENEPAEILNACLRELKQEAILKWALLDAIVLNLSLSRDRRTSNLTSKILFEKIGTNSIFCFPSTQHFGGTNFALRPEVVLKNFKVCGGINIRHAEHLGYGLIDMHGDDTLIGIGNSGELHWGSVKNKIYDGNSFAPVKVHQTWVNRY